MDLTKEQPVSIKVSANLEKSAIETRTIIGLVFGEESI
jgi:hypothetical protein